MPGATMSVLRACLLLIWALPWTFAHAELGAGVDAAIDEIAKHAVADGQTAGLVVAVAEAGKPTFLRAYGQANIEWQAPVTTDTVFRIGSITKQFTAAAMLLLEEDRKLSLDDKLAKYLPDFPRAEQVSLRQLLNHTSGIHSYPGRSEATIVVTGISVADMVKHIGTLGYDFDPGTAWAYSNSNYFLAGAVIEKVSARTFREFVQERLFDRLGLKNTAVDMNEEVVARRAAGYERDRKRPGYFLNAAYSQMSVPYAAGGVRSTAADLIRWTTALHSGQVLSAASYKAMTTPAEVQGAAPAHYGLGLHLDELEGQMVIGHGGGIDGFESRLYYLTDRKLTVVILANTQGGAGNLAAAVAGVLRPAAALPVTGQR